MRNVVAALVMIMAGVPMLAHADDFASTPTNIALPGFVSSSFSSGEPTEPGNVMSGTAVEQGVTLVKGGPFFVVGFMNFAYRTDSKGYTWNNTNSYQGGAKLVHVDRHGVFEAAFGVMGEERGEFDRVRPMTRFSYWRGWRGDALSRARAVAFPGSTYVASGHLTTRESRNWITAASIEQGVTVYSKAHFALTPFGRVTTGTDTDNHPWNKRTRLDEGVKVSRAIAGGVIDAGIARRQTYDTVSNRLTPSNVLFVNFWMGWTPHLIIR